MTPFNSTTDAFQLHPGLASEFMRDPVKVRIGAEGLKASHSITQIVEVVEPNDKDSHLTRLLKKYCGGQTPTPRTLIFALYKKECARVAENLRRVLSCLSHRSPYGPIRVVNAITRGLLYFPAHLSAHHPSLSIPTHLDAVQLHP